MLTPKFLSCEVLHRSHCDRHSFSFFTASQIARGIPPLRPPGSKLEGTEKSEILIVVSQLRLDLQKRATLLRAAPPKCAPWERKRSIFMRGCSDRNGCVYARFRRDSWARGRTSRRADRLSAGKEVVIGTAALPAGSAIAFHVHPRDEAACVLNGTFILKVKGQPDRIWKPCDTFFNPRGSIYSRLAPHGADGKIAVSTWIVDKGKPLATSVEHSSARHVNGRLTKAELFRPNRQARSAALVMPIRLPRTIDGLTSGASILKGVLSRRLPLSEAVTASASPSRPGPEHNKRRFALPRRLIITSMPVVGSSARIRTPAA